MELGVQLMLLLIITYINMTQSELGCPTNIHVVWKSHPPFAFPSVASGHPMGSVADPLHHMLDVCCGSTKVTYEDMTFEYKPLLMQNATFVMPITRDPIQVSAYMHVNARKFIPTQLGGGK